MIDTLKSAGSRTEANSWAAKPPAKEESVPRQPELPGEAATLSAAIQRLMSERDTHKPARALRSMS